MSAVEVIDVRKSYGGYEAAVEAVRGVSLRVAEGEFVVIMGASGSGKSTLLHLIGGLDQPTAGRILIGGTEIAAMSDRERTLFRRRRLGIVFQAYNLLPTLSAVENVMLPALIDGKPATACEERAKELLRLVDLEHRFTHRPQAMSGGEQQRVAIARALMNEPVVLLADEPTGNLDTKHGDTIWRLLASLARDQRRTIVAVTHEPHGAAHADRIIVVKDGEIAGELTPGREERAAHVATRYAELVG